MTLKLAQALLLFCAISLSCVAATGKVTCNDRSSCKHSCSSLVEEVPRLCGPTDNEHCFSKHRRECRETLVRLKSTSDSSCHCQNPSSRSCQDYFNLLYNHPCSRAHPPSAQAFQRDLEFGDQLVLSRPVALSCSSALHTCRRSPLCRRVYDEYRRRCRVRGNSCRMPNAALCYNSYQLIKLTPLWTCTCDKLTESRCKRIQKTIIGNACIGPFPEMPEVPYTEDEYEEPSEELAATRAPSRVRTTFAQPTTRGPITRVTPPASRTRGPIILTTSQTPAQPTEDIDYGITSEEPEILEETDSEPSVAESISQIFPGPDEDFVLIPQIAATLLQMFYGRIRAILVDSSLMVTLPPTTTMRTTTTALVSTNASEDLNADEEPPPEGEDYEEPTPAVAEQLVVTTTHLPTPASTAATQKISHRTRGRTGASTTSSTTPVASLTLSQTRILSTTSSTTKTAKSQTVPFTRAQTLTSSALLVTTSTILATTEEEEYVDYTSAESSPGVETLEEITPTTEMTTTTTEETTTPAPKSLSESCWNTIRDMRRNAQFSEALNEFGQKCSWSSTQNDSCDAAGCIEYKARVRLWMGRQFEDCRNLTCEEDDENCETIMGLLNPGCVDEAKFLYEMESETVTCRDIRRRNLVLTVRRGNYKRVYSSEDCSELCTCDVNGKVKCDLELPCIESKECRGEYATFPPGSPGYKGYQGQCICHTSRMICIRPVNYTTAEGSWLFMAYSKDEEDLVSPIINMTVKENVVQQLKKLPYPPNGNEPCLFHMEESEPEYVILFSDAFDLTNYTKGFGSNGTLQNEVNCDKYFRWIVSEVTERRSLRTDPLLSLMKIAEVEFKKRSAPASSTALSPCLNLLSFSVFLVMLFRSKN